MRPLDPKEHHPFGRRGPRGASSNSRRAHPQAGPTGVRCRATQALPQRDTVLALSFEDIERLRVVRPATGQNAQRTDPGRYRAPHEYRLRMVFRDAGGRWWLRDERGVLQEAAEPTWEDEAFEDEG
jgi:hypothetical protein